MILRIALDIGTKYTSIFMDGYGVVLHEPTVIAFTGDVRNHKVRAVGYKAAEMSGKTGEKTTVIYPITEGVVVDKTAASLMLREFLKKIIPDRLFLSPRFKALLCVPCGLEMEERLIAEDVCISAGIADVTMIDCIIPAAIGSGLPVGQARASLIADIGGGTSEVAVLSLSSIVNGCSVSVAGGYMDERIKQYISAKYNLKIGRRAAEKLKIDIGTLFDNDIASANVSGIDLESKSPVSVNIKSSDILESVITPYHQICDAIQGIINICPPEIAADIHNQGIILSGGGALIPGLEQLVSTRLNLNVVLAPEPMYSTIVGAGKLLNDPELLAEIFSQV